MKKSYCSTSVPAVAEKPRIVRARVSTLCMGPADMLQLPFCRELEISEFGRICGVASSGLKGYWSAELRSNSALLERVVGKSEVMANVALGPGKRGNLVRREKVMVHSGS